MSFCTKCGTILDDNAKFCSKCGKSVNESNESSAGFSQHSTFNSETIFDTVTEKINNMAGGRGSVKLRIKDLFSDIFRRHTTEDAETIFTYGTAKTIPLLSSVDTSWPKPWLYSRVLAILMAVFIILYVCLISLDNILVLPGIITVGSFAVPLSLLIFFFECNAPRDISFFNAMKIFLIGGTASILSSLILFEIIGVGELDYIGAILTGIIEEVGKLVIVMFFVKTMKPKFLLGGMLIGAAVGAGFAAFESSGYAFLGLLGEGTDNMFFIVFLRAFLAPGGHITWAAISGYAVMMINKGEQLDFEKIFKAPAFYKLFAIPVALHAIWDMPIPLGDEIYLIPILLTICCWIVVLVLVQGGLNEVSVKAEQCRNVNS